MNGNLEVIYLVGTYETRDPDLRSPKINTIITTAQALNERLLAVFSPWLTWDGLLRAKSGADFDAWVKRFMQQCDAALLLPGSEDDPHQKEIEREIALASLQGIPFFHELEEIDQYQNEVVRQHMKRIRTEVRQSLTTEAPLFSFPKD